MRPKAEVGAMWTHTWVRFHCSFTHLHLGYSPVLSSEGKYTVPGHSSLTLRSKIQQSKHTQFILLCLDCEGGDSSLCGSSKAEQTRLPEFLAGAWEQSGESVVLYVPWIWCHCLCPLLAALSHKAQGLLDLWFHLLGNLHSSGTRLGTEHKEWEALLGLQTYTQKSPGRKREGKGNNAHHKMGGISVKGPEDIHKVTTEYWKTKRLH